MPRYFFRYRTLTRLAFTDKVGKANHKANSYTIQLQRRKGKMIVYDHTMARDGFKIPYGLGFDLEFEETNKYWAKDFAEWIINDFVYMMSFLESCYISPPELILSYEVPKRGNILNRYSGKIISNENIFLDIDIKRLIPSKLAVFVAWINKAESKKREIILGSLIWFFKALSTENLEERFIYLWIAVEKLESILRKHFGNISGSVKRKPKCPYCNTEITTFCQKPKCKGNSIEFKYTQALYIEGYKPIEARHRFLKSMESIRQDRNKLFHGGINSGDLSMDIAVCHKIYRYAIYELLGIKDPIMLNILIKSSDRFLPPRKKLESFMDGAIKTKKKIIQIEEQPYITGSFKESYFYKDKKTFSNRLKCKYSINSPIEWGKVKQVVKLHPMISCNIEY